MLYDKFRAKEWADLEAPRQASPMEMEMVSGLRD